MKHVLITGATGLIGSEIVKLCHEQNIIVHYLTTSKDKIATQHNYKGFYWDPIAGEIDASCFENVSVIINLVGASISKRWTDEYKIEIIESRIQTLDLLYDTIKTNKFPIEHIISASAVGVYPDSLTNYYEENHINTSDSFLGEVVTLWEKAVDRFSFLSVNVAKIRIGLVLSEKGGALPQIAKPIKFGVGAAFGSGEQWQSWIHLTDLARLFLFIADGHFEGVFNGVAPNPVTNQELTKRIAQTLNRPLILPNIPKFIMKLVLGEMHIILFESQRVSSKKIEALGFKFDHYTLESAIVDILK